MKRLRLLSIIYVFSLSLVGCGQFQSAEFKSQNSETAAPVSTLVNVETPSVLNAQGLLSPNMIGILNQIPNCLAPNSNLECMILLDSFERQDPEAPTAQGFGWSKIIDDVLGGNGERVTAEIYHEADMGPTTPAITLLPEDEKRALWYSGRTGCSVHSIYLISQPIDLRGYNSVMIAFHYLAVDLEKWNYNHKSGQENIRLEVCQGSLDDCGIGATHDKARLSSNAWVPYHVSMENAGDGLNGHNHQLSDWSEGYANIDLQQLEDSEKSQFVFRIAVTIDEGFKTFVNNTPVISSNMIDGVALDNVVALASKVKVDDTVNPGPDDNDGSSL